MKLSEMPEIETSKIIPNKDLLEMRGGTTPECFPLSTWECTCKGIGEQSVLGTITFEGNIEEEGCFDTFAACLETYPGTVAATCYEE